MLLMVTAPALPKYVGEQAAAAITGFSVGTLRNWRSRGEGPSIIRKGRSIRYRVDTLIAWMEAGAVEMRG